MYLWLADGTLRRGLVGLAFALLAGCSLQDFDRVQQDAVAAAGDSNNGGSAGGSAGRANDPANGTGGAAGSSSGLGGSGPADPPQTARDSGVHAEPGIVNGSFEQGYLAWAAEPPDALGVYAFVQWPPTGSTTPDGLNEMSTWAESVPFSVRIYQPLTDLEDGQYTFKGHFNFGTGHNAVRLFARGCGGADVDRAIPQTLPSQWQLVELTGIEVVGGQCQVGFFVDANAGNWLNSDLFSFERDAE